MKKIWIITFMFCCSLTGYAQTTIAEKQLKTQTADTVEGWKNSGSISINASQTSLTNWASGGQSSVALGTMLSLQSQYRKNKGLWENYLDLGYGSLKQGKKSGWMKTDDKIDFTSKFGYKAVKNWYYAGLVNFKTQMAPGYNYPNDSVAISGFLAPGYLLGGLGFDYQSGGSLTAYISPVTLKVTFVRDQELAELGAFGVDAGKKIRSEFGGYIRLQCNKSLMENISILSKLDLFSNYLKNPQNIDVSWENLLSMKVNKYVSASLSTHLLYDDDIDIAVDENDDGIADSYGPRLQFKEVLAVGLSLIF